jgi:hypothetical protein
VTIGAAPHGASSFLKQLGGHLSVNQQHQWAAGSSLGAFLLLLADGDRAHREAWPPKWELAIDPDLEKCLRAPAIWNAG